MSTDGVLGAVWLPTDGWLDPSGLALALAAGARGRGASGSDHTRVVGDRRRATAGSPASRSSKRRRASDDRADVVVNAGGMFAPEIGRLAGVTVPIIPMAHEYLFTEPIDGRDAGPAPAARPRQPVYFREEVGGLCMGGYERHPAPWALDGDPARLQRQAARARLAALRGDHGRRRPARPGDRRRRDQPDDQRTRGRSPRTTSSSSARATSGGFFVAAGFCAHGIAGAGGIGRQVATWIVDGEPELDLWKMDIRRFGAGSTAARRYTLARTTEVYATYYDIHYPNEERQAGRPLRTCRRPTTRLAALGAAFGEKSGWERPNWFEPNADDRGSAAGRARGAPAARLGRPALVARDRRPRRWRRGRRPALFDETSFAKIEVAGPGAPAFLSGCARTTSTVPVGSIVYTPDAQPARRDRVRPHGDPPRRGPVPARDRDGVRQPRPRLAPDATCPTTAAVQVERPDSGAGLLRAVGPARARHPRRAARRDDLSDAAFPYLTARRDHGRPRAGPRPAGHLRRRARLGAVRPDGVRPARCGTRCGRPGAEHGLVAGRLPGDRRAPPREGLPRLVERHHAGRDARTRPASGFAVALDKEGGFIGREALRAARAAGRASGCAASSSTTRARSASATSRSGSTARSSAGSRRGGYGFAVERSIAYAYLPPDRAAIGTRGEVEVFGEWVGFEVAPRAALGPGGREDPGVSAGARRGQAG